MKKSHVLVATLAVVAVVTGYGIYQLSDRVLHLQQEVLKVRKECRESERERMDLEKKIKSLRAERSTPGVYTPHLRSIITSTLQFLGVKDARDWTRLVLLTVVTESDKGRYTRQVKGPAKGIVQCEPATEKETLSWVKKRHPELYAKILKLRVPARLIIHEAEYNSAYSIALCYCVYFMRSVDPRGKSVESLAKLYKRHYNTPAGKATVHGVLAKLEELGVKI